MTDASATTQETTQEPRPPLFLIRGGATDEEVAALTAVLSAVAAGGSAPAPRRPRVWAAPDRLVRRSLPHGPGAWRASGLPR